MAVHRKGTGNVHMIVLGRVLIRFSRCCTYLPVPLTSQINRKRKQQQRMGKKFDKSLEKALAAAGGEVVKKGKDGRQFRDYQDWQWENNWDWDFVQERWRNPDTDAYDVEGDLAAAVERGEVSLDEVQGFIQEREEHVQEVQRAARAEMVRAQREAERRRARAQSASSGRSSVSRAAKREAAKAVAEANAAKQAVVRVGGNGSTPGCRCRIGSHWLCGGFTLGLSGCCGRMYRQ